VYSAGPFQDLVSVPGVSGSVVRRQNTQGDFGLPLLLTVYPCGRDSIDMPQRGSFGISAGVDLLKVSAYPRVFGGVTFDWKGFGISLLGSAERVQYVANPAGTVVGATSQPQVDNDLRPGGSIAVTTDLDIFEAIFEKYFQAPQLPTATQPQPPASFP
jgi:hypothetical protein